MASLTLLFFLFLQLPLSLSSTLFLPLTKEPSTNQYLTRIHHGSAQLPTSLIIDLNSPFLWLDCSSSPKPITAVHCRSIQCTSAAPNPCPGPSSISSNQQACSLLLQNPTTKVSATGELVETTVSFHDQISAVDSFLLSCAPSILLSGLPSGAKGVFGLGRARTGAISQISHSLDYPKRFSLCLSSESGMIYSSDDEIDVFKSMTYTPLLDNKGDGSYIINLKAVQVHYKKVRLENVDPNMLSSSIKISTVDTYSRMETRVYREFVTAFVNEAESLNLNMKRVPPQGGFEVCYSVVERSTIVVPVIDLVLQSEMVKWRIYGHNSMVKMNDEVMCLGFLDGGLDLGDGISIILGAHQLEDNLLEFDLVSSMLGFSSSLMKSKTSCSQLSLSAMHRSLQAY